MTTEVDALIHPWLEVILFVLPFVLPIAAAIYLGIRLRWGTAARSTTG